MKRLLIGLLISVMAMMSFGCSIYFLIEVDEEELVRNTHVTGTGEEAVAGGPRSR